MPFTLVDLLLGFALPAITSWLMCQVYGWILGRSIVSGSGPSRFVDRLVWPVALAAGFLLGYYTLGLGPVVPKFDRDWLPLTALIALPVTAWLCRKHANLWGVVLLAIPCIALVAYLLVPQWESLLPDLLRYRVLLSTASLGLLLLSLLASRWLDVSPVNANDSSPQDEPKRSEKEAPVHLVGWCCVLIAIAAAVPLMALCGSLRFASVAMSLLGSGLGLLSQQWASRGGTFSLRAVAPVWVFVLAGLLFTAQVNSSSSVPVGVYLLLPFAPTFGHAVGLLAGNRGRGFLVPLCVTGIVCACALGWAVAAEWDALTSTDGY